MKGLVEHQAQTTIRAKQVFLVEQDSGDIALTRRAIMQAGSFVHLEALQTADALIDILDNQGVQSRADLILIDMNLLKDGGFMLVRWIRSHSVMAHTPVVMISNATKEKDIFDCYKYGASSVIAKSADFTEYAHILKDVCSYWLNISLLPHDQCSPQADQLIAAL